VDQVASRLAGPSQISALHRREVPR
jgi:hypothetical protein